MIKTPNFLLQSWPCPLRCLASTQAQLRRHSLYGQHLLSHVSASFLSSLQGTSLAAPDLTLNAHLQINSFGLGELPEKRQSSRATNSTSVESGCPKNYRLKTDWGGLKIAFLTLCSNLLPLFFFFFEKLSPYFSSKLRILLLKVQL